MLYDTEKCVINNSSSKLMVLQGLEDFILVNTDDVLMICKKDQEQRIKQFVTDVEVEKGNDYL